MFWIILALCIWLVGFAFAAALCAAAKQGDATLEEEERRAIQRSKLNQLLK